jgi:hypothetical protein
MMDDRKTAPPKESPEPVACSSPPCMLHELDPDFALGVPEPKKTPPAPAG